MTGLGGERGGSRERANLLPWASGSAAALLRHRSIEPRRANARRADIVRCRVYDARRRFNFRNAERDTSLLVSMAISWGFQSQQYSTNCSALDEEPAAFLNQHDQNALGMPAMCDACVECAINYADMMWIAMRCAGDARP